MPKHTFGSLTDEDEDLRLPLFGDREYIGPPDLKNLQSGYGTAGYGNGIGEHVFFNPIIPELPPVDTTVAPDVDPKVTLPPRDADEYVGSSDDSTTSDANEQDITEDEEESYSEEADAMSNVGIDETDPDYAEDETTGPDAPNDPKIVCTAMNSMYGFGGFRNAIWMKYARERIKDEEYELGYHKLIMPLVRRMETNKFIRTIVEFNARQRTFNLRREMRGQKTTLYYRIVEKKIIFPAFFAVGWLVKKNILKKAKI
jgi:hypothetical protein